MHIPRTLAIALAVAVLAIAGCGVGGGSAAEGVATLLVTRGHGTERLLEASSVDPPESETVVRFLDREAEIETGYGGNFVHSIEGISGGVEAGRSRDWFFYVNGYWSPVGAGESPVRPGDRIWWDYRDWTDAYQVSAVVGSWPEPFLHGYRGEVPATEVVCLAPRPRCAEVGSRLAAEGVEAKLVDGLGEASAAAETLRVLVGPWQRLRADPVARLLERGPEASGVYATVGRCPDGGHYLAALTEHAEPRPLAGEAGFVAALARGDGQPTWVVGATASGEPLRAAIELLDERTLGDHYAIATAGGETTRLPIAPDVATSPASACGPEAAEGSR